MPQFYSALIKAGFLMSPEKKRKKDDNQRHLPQFRNEFFDKNDMISRFTSNMVELTASMLLSILNITAKSA